MKTFKRRVKSLQKGSKVGNFQFFHFIDKDAKSTISNKEVAIFIDSKIEFVDYLIETFKMKNNNNLVQDWNTVFQLLVDMEIKVTMGIKYLNITPGVIYPNWINNNILKMNDDKKVKMLSLYAIKLFYQNKEYFRKGKVPKKTINHLKKSIVVSFEEKNIDDINKFLSLVEHFRDKFFEKMAHGGKMGQVTTFPMPKELPKKLPQNEDNIIPSSPSSKAVKKIVVGSNIKNVYFSNKHSFQCYADEDKEYLFKISVKELMNQLETLQHESENPEFVIKVKKMNCQEEESEYENKFEWKKYNLIEIEMEGFDLKNINDDLEYREYMRLKQKFGNAS